MLVYLNVIRFEGPECFSKVMECVVSWLSRKVRKAIKTEDFENGAVISGQKGVAVRLLAATAVQPLAYSAALMHPDSDVPGRRWETEIGILSDHASGVVEASIQVTVIDVSAAVRAPVQASRPLIVNDLQAIAGLSRDMVGSAPILVGNGGFDLAGLKEVIWSTSRLRPIVILSPKFDGTYPISTVKL